MGEYEVHTNSEVQYSLSETKRDCQSSKMLIKAILNREKVWEEKRIKFAELKVQQRDAMEKELEASKEIVQKMHNADEMNSSSAALASILATPAPVEQRLLSSVQAPDTEESKNVDLSTAPSI